MLVLSLGLLVLVLLVLVLLVLLGLLVLGLCSVLSPTGSARCARLTLMVSRVSGVGAEKNGAVLLWLELCGVTGGA